MLASNSELDPLPTEPAATAVTARWAHVVCAEPRRTDCRKKHRRRKLLSAGAEHQDATTLCLPPNVSVSL